MRLAGRAALAPGIVVATPAREVSVAEAALEVACLEQMLRDPELIAKDPLVEVELRHLLDDARGYLHRAVDLLVTPQKGGPTFWHQGQSLQLESAAELRSFLSRVIGEIYRADAEDQQRADQPTPRVGAGRQCTQEARDGHSRACWLAGTRDSRAISQTHQSSGQCSSIPVSTVRTATGPGDLRNRNEIAGSGPSGRLAQV